MDAEEEMRILDEFWEWFAASRLPREGWYAADADAYSLGRIPVADLDRERGSIAGLTDAEIVTALGCHQEIVSLEAMPRSLPRARPWAREREPPGSLVRPSRPRSRSPA